MPFLVEPSNLITLKNLEIAWMIERRFIDTYKTSAITWET